MDDLCILPLVHAAYQRFFLSHSEIIKYQKFQFRTLTLRSFAYLISVIQGHATSKIISKLVSNEQLNPLFIFSARALFSDRFHRVAEYCPMAKKSLICSASLKIKG